MHAFSHICWIFVSATGTTIYHSLFFIAIIFTEEKRTNKTAAFSRVVAQLNSSYDELSATIEETRQDTECIMKQRRDVTTDISNLVADNKQVEDWVKELMTVIDTLEKGGRRE